MKLDHRFVLAAGLIAAFTVACGDDDGGTDTGTDTGADVGSDVDSDTMGGEDIVVSENITADTTWTAENRYLLQNLTFITGGATLTIEPGTTVYGADGSALVVASDGMIDAQGTATNPIVFTSDQAPGSRAPGQWGGVVMLGNAPINVTSNNIEGMEASDLSAYGGSNAAHDCGTIRYARIEFAGSVFGTDNELNGLTVGGCGSDTELSYIQVHRGLDDGVEFFGGTANADHIVITRPGDDGLDWDQGFSGQVQHLIIQQDGAGGERGFEGDNLEGAHDSTPRSNPHIWNATLVSSGTNAEQLGMKVRRGSSGMFGNFIVMNFMEGAIDVDSVESGAEVTAGNMTFQNFLFFNIGADGSTYFDVDSEDDDGGVDEDAVLRASAGMVFDTDPMLAAPNDLAAPDFTPAAASPATAGATPPAGFDASATYMGAIEPGGTDWTLGWTAYPEN